MKKLIEKIMSYWNDCICGENASADKDFKVNNLIYDYALSVGINQELIDNRVDLTVNNMTNSQKKEIV